MNIDEKFDGILKHYDAVQSKLSSGDLSPADMARLGKEFSTLRDIAARIQDYKKVREDYDQALAVMNDPAADRDMKALAEEEAFDLKKKLPDMEQAIKLSLLPRDKADAGNAIMEFRAGAGGDEAGIFAADLVDMYQKYSGVRGWRFDIMSMSYTGVGGIKEAIAEVSGQDVFARLKFESGVHRVQRVPKTEASGRIHTSTATVAVLPEAEDVEIEIREQDLRIDVYRSSGPGGQSVNTTDSAVRITHLPTGVVVSQQDEKSQHKNRAKAMKILKARLYEAERQRIADERAAHRRGQVGTGDRSERIRTYNFQQGRVTDHRINVTLYSISDVMSGVALDELIEPLIAADQAERLAEVDGAPVA